MTLAIIFGKAVDDKTIGIYIDGVYFAGIANNEVEANIIARAAATNIRGGIAIIKILPINKPNTLMQLFQEAKIRFAKIEQQMVETETTMEANIERRRSSKRRK